MRCKTLAVLVLAPLVVTGCPRDRTDEGLTRAEASQALEETTLESQGQTLASNTIEIGTSFTLGQAVEAAAEEISSFVQSQLPCAAVAVANGTVTVEYAAKGSTCSYRGHVITGTSRITVVKTDSGDVVVDHQWTALSNGIVQIDGTATVTWSSANQSRHVQHDLVIERLRDQKTLDSSGDRTQTPLNGDLGTGIAVSGSRSWSSAGGTWDLAITDVQMRWADPVPQAGSYVLLTPKRRSLTLDFERKDADTITVTLSSESRSFAFDVTSTGETAAQ